MTKDDHLYSKIGMALISAQKVEYLTGELLELLAEFDKEIYHITTYEFLKQSSKSSKAHKTLGTIFKQLKLNPKLVIEDELTDYLKKRNQFVHKFWKTFLIKGSPEQEKDGLDFCYDFGRHSDKILSFFKGFVYMLTLRHFKDKDHLDSRVKNWDVDFEFFISSLQECNLNNPIS